MTMATQQETLATLGEDRRPALYGTLVTCLVLNNVAAALRIIANYMAHYRKGERVFLEDIFVFTGGVCGQPRKRQRQYSTHHILDLRERCHREPARLYVLFPCVQGFSS